MKDTVTQNTAMKNTAMKNTAIIRTGAVAAVPVRPAPGRGAEPVVVPVDALASADSPRTAAPDHAHVRLLAESETPLPPILVHRPTMRVVDGVHRLLAARLRGQRGIAVEYVDGSEDEAFIRGVLANAAHGLPLSRADREAAAARITGSHAHWSDRLLAEVVGLSAPTVAVVRRRLAADPGAVTGPAAARVGRDGRVRPLSATEGRLRAQRFLAEHPHASLRQIARQAGISIGTARDVKLRIGRGEEPVPARSPAGQRSPEPAGNESAGPDATTSDTSALLRSLRGDPALTSSDAGRALLQWLGVQRLGSDRRTADFIGGLPPHRRAGLAVLALSCAEAWTQLARELERGAGDRV